MVKRLTGFIMFAVIAALIVAFPASAATPGVSAGGSRPLVCLDPGHGGSDSGALGNGLVEKDLNLDIARRARPIIQAMGYDVLMTRESDVYVSLQDRCTIANRARASIFVSVHNNAYESSSTGTETYCFYNSVDGRKLATDIHSEVVRRTMREDRGVKEAGFYVLRHTDMTAALLEGAFLTNPADAKCLADPRFRQKIAEGVAAGVGDYLVDPGRFDEYILLMNPNPVSASKVRLDYMTGDGRHSYDELAVPPGTRYTVHVDERVFNADVSTQVTSLNGVPVVAERAMYFDFEKGRGGSDALGVEAPARRWYMAEGSTNWGFSTFVLVENTYEKENHIIIHFMRSDGVHRSFKYDLEPLSRFTLDASTIKGFEKADFSVEVDSEKPVVAERSMYFTNHGGISGGHASAGVPMPKRRWYLAEGYTGKGFQTYLLMGNPNAAPCLAHVTYMLPGGVNVDWYYDLPAYTRRSILVNDVPGVEKTDVSMRVDTSLPVVVERSMYFDYNGVREGSNSMASSAASRTWYLAEGYTGRGFDTYVLLLNPGDVDSTAVLRFMMPDGRRGKLGISLKAHSRSTVWLNAVEGLENSEVSTYVSSQQPIVVERSMYFRSGNRVGGHNAMGATEPSLEWYFAEGCTR
jgi:N-acetylmuramoyl-L-alanine amidase